MWKIASVLQILLNFTIKLYLYLPKENRERKLSQGARDAYLNLLSMCLVVIEFCFDAMFSSTVGNENSDMDHIKRSRGSNAGHRFSSPALDKHHSISLILLDGSGTWPQGCLRSSCIDYSHD